MTPGLRRLVRSILLTAYLSSTVPAYDRDVRATGARRSYDSELAIAFAVDKGYPESIFVPSPNDARSTREEALAMVPELRRMGVKRVLLVTSDYHTRRAGRTFRAAAPELQIDAVSFPDADFQLDRWWLTREGRKYAVTEWFKTVAEGVGL